MAASLSRRAFLGQLAAAGIGVPALSRLRPARGASQLLRVGVPDFVETTDRGMGITLGAEEARHAAQLLGGAIDISVTALAPTHAQPGDLCAIIGDARVCSPTPHGNALFLNAACTADALRDGCDRRIFHVAPSDAMRHDALALSGDNAASVVVWDHSLSRFGADTLNRRFTERFNRPMSGDAWTGWFAVKVLWETALRTRSVDPATLGTALASEGTRFDGHKGRPLSFRPWDHQLRQPLYVVHAGTVSEVPPAGSAGDAANGLDRLGASMQATACRAG